MVAAALTRGTIRATPRSAILATISESRRTFLADKSRWMTGGDRSWRYARPHATLYSTEHLRAMEKKDSGVTAPDGGGVSGASKS
ncbi:hypothetical protein GBAR_LOCUS15820 [Geodia barretti]|uniref:Uncharacterized protein n=2 Tax=Geodia barretti TaxID=519541 RepID=A0AA35WPA1_GEOBA|nr:hypothetical protein GBAR_LOCUS15820 [Geodia barretti]